MESAGIHQEDEKLKQDRLNIVSKYEKGPGAENDEEDGDEYVYQLGTDQYGFLLKVEPSLISEQEEGRRRMIEIKRRMKWLKMVRHWDKYDGTEKLAKRVYKGIPQGLRGDVWRMLLEVYHNMEETPNLYWEMKARAHNNSCDIRQIDLDVIRTYRNHIMFQKRYSIKQQQLFHVLAAYSVYNTEVGYCQGMSQIAALLLMYMSEEEAFWALHSLLYGTKHKMHGFFIPGFPKLLRFQDHHDRILKKFMPKLKKHLDKNEVFASLYTMKWFFQCFLDRCPFPLSLRLWDIYILEGEKLLTAMSYATLKMHRNFIKSQDMDGIVCFLQEELVKDFGSPDDAVVDYLKGCMIDLKRSSMDIPPHPSDAEVPKRAFGSLMSNKQKSPSKKIPEFAKHSADIKTLVPEKKSKGSQKKKDTKRKNTLGQSAIPINGASINQKPVNTKITGNERGDHINLSLLSRGSSKRHTETVKIKHAKQATGSFKTVPNNGDGKKLSSTERDKCDKMSRRRDGRTTNSHEQLNTANGRIALEAGQKDSKQFIDTKDNIECEAVARPSNESIIPENVSTQNSQRSVSKISALNFDDFGPDSKSFNKKVAKFYPDDLSDISSPEQEKAEAPSFYQLSAVLDSIENKSPALSSSTTNSQPVSPAHRLVANRPRSVYDNVPNVSLASTEEQTYPNLPMNTDLPMNNDPGVEVGGAVSHKCDAKDDR